MAIYSLSYHLHEDGASRQRQFGLMRAVHGVQRRYWDRTDNFVVFETAHTIDFLGGLLKSEINPKIDLFLLFEVGGSDAVVCGNNSDPDILSILPKCRQIG